MNDQIERLKQLSYVFTVPWHENAKLKQLVGMVQKDVGLQTLWKCSNVMAIDRMGYTDHGPTHVKIVANSALKLLRMLVEKKVVPSIVKNYGQKNEDAEVIVFAYGIVAAAARRAVREARSKGIRAGLFRAITLWPFPDEELASAAAGAARIIVAEMNLGQMTGEVQRAVGREKDVATCLKATGEAISPEEILLALEGRDMRHV